MASSRIASGVPTIATSFRVSEHDAFGTVGGARSVHDHAKSEGEMSLISMVEEAVDDTLQFAVLGDILAALSDGVEFVCHLRLNDAPS